MLTSPAQPPVGPRLARFALALLAGCGSGSGTESSRDRGDEAETGGAAGSDGCQADRRQSGAETGGGRASGGRGAGRSPATDGKAAAGSSTAEVGGEPSGGSGADSGGDSAGGAGDGAGGGADGVSGVGGRVSTGGGATTGGATGTGGVDGPAPTGVVIAGPVIDVGTNPSSPANDFSDTNGDPDGDGYTALDDYLEWMSKPHDFTNPGASVSIDLGQAFVGFTDSPAYSSSNSVNAAVSISGIASVTPTACGLASWKLTVTDAAGSTMTKDMGAFVDAAAGSTCP